MQNGNLIIHKGLRAYCKTWNGFNWIAFLKYGFVKTDVSCRLLGDGYNIFFANRDICVIRVVCLYPGVVFNNKNLFLQILLLKMFRKLVSFKLLVILLQGISTALQPVTENNHVLVGHVFQQLYARDWFNCIQACHDEPRCISYNYERLASANGLCELNDCGVEDLCDKDKSLIYSVGFVFQQIREGKVSCL